MGQFVAESNIRAAHILQMGPRVKSVAGLRTGNRESGPLPGEPVILHFLFYYILLRSIINNYLYCVVQTISFTSLFTSRALREHCLVS